MCKNYYDLYYNFFLKNDNVFYILYTIFKTKPDIHDEFTYKAHNSFVTYNF